LSKVRFNNQKHFLRNIMIGLDHKVPIHIFCVLLIHWTITLEVAIIPDVHILIWVPVSIFHDRDRSQIAYSYFLRAPHPLAHNTGGGHLPGCAYTYLGADLHLCCRSCTSACHLGLYTAWPRSGGSRCWCASYPSGHNIGGSHLPGCAHTYLGADSPCYKLGMSSHRQWFCMTWSQSDGSYHWDDPHSSVRSTEGGHLLGRAYMYLGDGLRPY